MNTRTILTILIGAVVAAVAATVAINLLGGENPPLMGGAIGGGVGGGLAGAIASARAGKKPK
jgi:hypothetical protein